MAFIDPDFPILLGQELYRPDARYIMKYISRPRVKHDFLKQPGDNVQMDRYNYWSTPEAAFNKVSRQRGATQVIGVNNSRGITKEKVILTLEEYTGPSDATNPESPSTFQIPLKDIITAQRALWQYGVRGFHDSIGSSNLLQDFRKWEDRIYTNELLKTTFIYNPRGIADGATVNLTQADLEFSGKPPQFNVDDIEQVVTDLYVRNCPQFEDGNYVCACSPVFLKHLRSDDKFLEITRYYASNPALMPASAMSPGANGSFAPPQINFNAAPFTVGLTGGQANDVMGEVMMPMGFVFDGVRFFISNNLPKAQVSLTYSNASNASLNGNAVRTGELGVFYGAEAIGVGLGGNGPEILLNNNDDFQRFVIAIWR